MPELLYVIRFVLNEERGVIILSLTWKVLFSVLSVTSVSCVLARIRSSPASSVARWP